MHTALGDLFSVDDLFTVSAVGTRAVDPIMGQADAPDQEGSIVPLGPSLEMYLDKQKEMRRAKTTWNSMDMCFRWQLMLAYFEKHHPGQLTADPVLMARVQRVTRLSSCSDGSVGYDPASKTVVDVIIHGLSAAAAVNLPHDDDPRRHRAR